MSMKARRGDERSGKSLDVWFGVVVGVALVTRLIGLDHAPHFDEFYHLLAANSLLEDGDLCIAGCIAPYDRGAPFTYMVAGAVGALGSSVAVARLVSVLAGVLLVGGVYWWTRRVAGRIAAVAAALLLALSPQAIEFSQFVRFYAWQALLIWAGGVALFCAVHPARGGRPDTVGSGSPPVSPRRRVVVAALGVASFLLALSLQIATLIAAAGIVLWLLVDPILTRARREMRGRPGRLLIAGGLAIVLLAAGLATMSATGLLAELWAKYRSTNMFTLRHVNDLRYYHRLMLETYPTLYSLWPIAFVFVLWKRPAAALFTGSVFALSLV
ncbi:MAG TPA: hypothetical protein ENO23_04440, partial [Alphaproteobacteria bacterium]|nr:hypothetical protein [Alphaproteobacteria bacterium]